MGAVNTSKADFDRCAEFLQRADGLLVTAGARMGVGAGSRIFAAAMASGAYPALAKSGITFEEIASPQTFEEDSSLACGFYGHRLNLYRQTAPSLGV
jgi:NAD-dependent SIR2 family protein deacetylase